MHSIPPRITEKSYRLRVSNRTMVGVLEPPRFACVASGPKASNHRVMKPSSRNRRLPWPVRSTSRIQSLSRSQIGLDANRHIHLLSERTERESFLDIPSHRTHRPESRAMVASLPIRPFNEIGPWTGLRIPHRVSWESFSTRFQGHPKQIGRDSFGSRPILLTALTLTDEHLREGGAPVHRHVTAPR